jgi:hypothetical protein
MVYVLLIFYLLFFIRVDARVGVLGDTGSTASFSVGVNGLASAFLPAAL